MARDAEQSRVVLEAKLELAEQAYRAYYPRIPSRTLREALTIVFKGSEDNADLDEDDVALYIPHYWALYLHDGRGPVSPRFKKFLVYYRNPRDDPRLADGYPVRASQHKRLSENDFKEGLRKNRRNYQLGIPPFMYVVKDDRGRPRSTGPAAGYHWFDQSMGVIEKAHPKIMARFEKYIDSIVVSEESTATFRWPVR